MKRFLGFVLTMALLGGGVFWLPYVQAVPAESVYQAAALLTQEAENGGSGMTFRDDGLDADEVYRALEAQYPYAFALHAVTRPNHTIELTPEVSRQARQEQAREYARVLAAGSILQTMTFVCAHPPVRIRCGYGGAGYAGRRDCTVRGRRCAARPQGRVRGLRPRV